MITTEGNSQWQIPRWRDVGHDPGARRSRWRFAIPNSVPIGEHNVVLEGVSANGDPVTVTLDVTIGGTLPRTGGTLWPSILPGAGLVAVGVFLARRRQRFAR